MTTWNLKELLPLVLDCGRLALTYFDYPHREYKDDDTVVTQADRAIEAYLTEALDHPASGSFVLGEETIAQKNESYLAEAFAATAWVIDPIDGTAPFSNNLPNWGVSVGLMQKGVLVEGVAFLAALGELYYTDRGVTYRETLGTDSDQWSQRLGTRTVALQPPASPDLPKGCMVSLSQQLARFGTNRLPFSLQVTGSAVFNLTRLAAGSYGAVVTKVKLWDFAGCLPMMVNLGWTIVRLGDGEPLTLTMDDRAIVNVKGHVDRWATLDHIVFAPSREAADDVRAHVSMP